MSLLKSEPFLTTSDIAKRLGVSEATARRDLAAVAGDDGVTRFRGGVMLAHDEEETPVGWRYRTEVASKRAIARAACRLVHDGQLIALDIGTTALYLAPLLASRLVTVVTNNLKAADLMADGCAQVVVLGGVVRPQERSILGPWVFKTLEAYRFSAFFMSVAGVSERGFTDLSADEIAIKQAIAERSDRIYVMADHSKFETSQGLIIRELAGVSGIITDQATPPRCRALCQRAGVELIVAPALDAQPEPG